MANLPSREVTFIRPQGDMTIRMVRNHVDSVVEAAKTLKATYVVFADDYSMELDRPVWAVFDMTKVEKLGRTNTYVLPIASKIFISEKNDAAVMWAVHQGRK